MTPISSLCTRKTITNTAKLWCFRSFIRFMYIPYLHFISISPILYIVHRAQGDLVSER